MNCPSCQQVLSDDARFCSSCGVSTAEINKRETEVLEQPETLKYLTDPLLGQVLHAKYQLVARLGEGGMGIVYCAQRLHIGDEVAIKVLHQQFVRDAKAVERFRREARSAAMIRHPNVVIIHDFNEAEAEGAPAYIVMELVRGKSLRSLLKQERGLPEARAVALMQQICAGVGMAHRQGIVHRDLKPDNVIVAPADESSGQETVKVLDFGLAKLRDVAAENSLTETGAMLGTPSYMPPEQCRGESLDARSDVYSLGAMLYEVLTGARPFHAPSVAGLIAKHLYDAPPAFPADITISPAVKAACMRALSKNPEERQADATVLSREIQAAVATGPLGVSALSPSVRSASIAPSPQHKSNSIRWVIGGFLLVLICAVIGAIAITYVKGGLAKPDVNSSNGSDAHATAANSGEYTGTVSESATPGIQDQDLVGTWTGTYGVLNQPATLIIKERKGSGLSGVLEQGGVRVAFTGTVDESSRKVTFKETQLLSGSGWSLGENTGQLSADRRKMSGTGKDAAGAQLGMSYEWSFSKP